MEERRNLKRIHRNLDVIEQTSGDLIGYTGNINHEGMMLVSKFQPALFLDVPIWVEVPEIKDKIPLVINGKWSQVNKNSDLYGTGCRLVESSPGTICKIKELVSEGRDDIQMKYNIPQNILDVTYCTYEFSCLTVGNCGERQLCEIDYTCGQHITVLKTEAGQQALNDCQYALEYNDEVICRCPVRYYLYQKYGV